jgi:hypothetical protein
VSFAYTNDYLSLTATQRSQLAESVTQYLISLGLTRDRILNLSVEPGSIIVVFYVADSTDPGTVTQSDIVSTVRDDVRAGRVTVSVPGASLVIDRNSFGTTGSSSSNGDGLSDGDIAAAVIMSIVGAVALTILIVFLVNQHRRRSLASHKSGGSSSVVNNRAFDADNYGKPLVSDAPESFA